MTTGPKACEDKVGGAKPLIILSNFMTLTPEEDKAVLQEVINEISQEKVKRARGRPRTALTDEERRLRKQIYDKKDYHQNPQKKIDAVIQNYVYKKVPNIE